MNGYTSLALAIVAEVVATSALQASAGFTRLWPSVLVVLGYGVAFYCLSITLKTVPMGVAYALWSGLGIVLIAIVGWLAFGQKLDAWAKFPDFQTRVAMAILRRQALDRIMIGFNGTSAAATTNRVTSPLLQDVNIGWLQKIRTNAADRVMTTVTVGATGAYKNLDALVVDAVNELIDEVHQDDTDLVVICGRSLLADKNFPMVNDASDNTNVLAGQVLLSQKQIGGLPAARVPHFPDNALLITSFDNLSIYYQKDAKRRYIQEKPSKNRIEDYQSSNEAYVIEAYEKVALVEGITIE